jgi:hypothetical protein
MTTTNGSVLFALMPYYLTPCNICHAPMAFTTTVLQNGYRSKNIAQYVSIMLIGNSCHGCFYALKREGKTIYGFGV